MSLARQYFSIILIICVNIFSNTFIRGMERPSRAASSQKNQVAQEKKAKLEALKIQRAVKKDPILQAAEKELHLHSGTRLLGYSATIIVQNNSALSVSVGPDSKKIMPNEREKIVVDFKKITNRLGHFELPIYDSENDLIAQLEGFRSRPIAEIRAHSFGAEFSTHYADNGDHVISPPVDGEKNYCVYLKLSGQTRIVGEMKLGTNENNISYEEKDNRSSTPKIPVSASSCSLSKNHDSNRAKEGQGLPVSQSSTDVASRRPAFPPARRASVMIDGNSTPSEHSSHGSLISLKNATIKALKRTGSLIKVTADVQPTDSGEKKEGKA